MTAYTITIAELVAGKPAKRCALVINADSEADLRCAIRDGLEDGGYGECDTCDEWYPEDQLKTLKSAFAADTRHCPDCYAEEIKPHPDDCRCETCQGIRESIAESVGDAIRDGDPVMEDDW